MSPAATCRRTGSCWRGCGSGRGIKSAFACPGSSRALGHFFFLKKKKKKKKKGGGGALKREELTCGYKALPVEHRSPRDVARGAQKKSEGHTDRPRAQFPHAPEARLVSIEADTYPRQAPAKSDFIDGAIGELSMFQQTFGYCAHGVDETIATLPACGTLPAREGPDGNMRVVLMRPPMTRCSSSPRTAVHADCIH